MRKPTIWVSTRSDIKQAVLSQMAGNFEFTVVTAKLICTFVFAYADCWFSHVLAQITSLWGNDRK